MGMEPAAKRARLELVQSSFVFLSMRPQQDGKLWPPKLLKLTVENKVVCDESEPHGSWTQRPNKIIIIFDHAGESNVKMHIFRPIAGTDAWLQVKLNIRATYRGVLIPSSNGPLGPM